VKKKRISGEAHDINVGTLLITPNSVNFRKKDATVRQMDGQTVACRFPIRLEAAAKPS